MQQENHHNNSLSCDRHDAQYNVDHKMENVIGVYQLYPNIMKIKDLTNTPQMTSTCSTYYIHTYVYAWVVKLHRGSLLSRRLMMHSIHDGEATQWVRKKLLIFDIHIYLPKFWHANLICNHKFCLTSCDP